MLSKLKPMLAEIYWITENLAIMPHPRGNDWLEDEIASFKEFGVDAIISLLEPIESYDLEITKEEYWCKEKGILFLHFSIPDRDIPTYFDEAKIFIKKICELMNEGKKISIHCRQGGGRSSMIAASILILQGFSVETAFELIKEKRGCQVPDTLKQIDWVKNFAEKI